MIFILIVASISSLFIGAYDMNIGSILQGDFEALQILLVSRIPRLLALAYVPSSTLVDKTIFAFIFSILGTCIFIYFMNRVKLKMY